MARIGTIILLMISVLQIVPLPPASLPKWSGSIAWVGDTKQALAVRPPTEKLLFRMAKKKGFDKLTGLLAQ